MDTQLIEMGDLVCARHTIPAGFDSAPLGDSFHLRPGHLAEVLEDAELIEFTRTEQYRRKEAQTRRPPVSGGFRCG
jgi:hypothetical protein